MDRIPYDKSSTTLLIQNAFVASAKTVVPLLLQEGVLTSPTQCTLN
jgi:hypothetical protein